MKCYAHRLQTEVFQFHWAIMDAMQEKLGATLKELENFFTPKFHTAVLCWMKFEIRMDRVLDAFVPDFFYDGSIIRYFSDIMQSMHFLLNERRNVIYCDRQ